MSTLTPKTAGFVNLSYCVAQVQADIQDYSDRNIERFTQWAIRDYTKLNIIGSVNTEIEYLTMDANGIVDLSPLTDYVDYIKLGIPVNGKIWILGANPKILLRRTELNATEAALIFKTGSPSIEVGSGSVFADHYVNGGFVTGLFGYGGGFSRSFFRVDMERNQIQFDTSVPRSEIILEYISTGVKATGGTVIPRSAVERIISFIHWQMKEFDPMVDRFTKARYQEMYEQQCEILTNISLRFKKEDYFQMLYSTYKQTVKM